MPAHAPQVQYAKVGPINTRFWALGDEGSTVLLIHGIGGSLEDWILNADALAKHHRVYALDLVGFGRSDKPEASYSLPFFAQFVRDFLIRVAGCDEAQDIEFSTAQTIRERPR